MVRAANLVLRDSSDGDLTATESYTFTVGSDGHYTPKDLAVVAVLPSDPNGSSPTLAISVESTDTNEKIKVSTVDNLTDSSTYTKRVVLPLPPVASENWKVDLTVGGTPDADGWGEALVWVEYGRSAAEVDAS